MLIVLVVPVRRDIDHIDHIALYGRNYHLKEGQVN